jgi:hypothetical protein
LRFGSSCYFLALDLFYFGLRPERNPAPRVVRRV